MGTTLDKPPTLFQQAEIQLSQSCTLSSALLTILLK